MPRLVLGDTAKPRNKSLIEPLGFVTLLGSVEPIAGECHFRQRCPQRRATRRRRTGTCELSVRLLQASLLRDG